MSEGKPWFEKYINTRKGNCKWCGGDKKIAQWNGSIVDCSRCSGTGDEPDLGPVGFTRINTPFKA